MSWRSGSALFCDMRPAIQTHIPDRERRIDFTAQLLQLFVNDDMDPCDVEELHPDVREAMRRAELDVADSEEEDEGEEEEGEGEDESS